jgi:hypothetical protein
MAKEFREDIGVNTSPLPANVIHTLPIGATCVYYIAGDKNNKCGAIVVGSHPGSNIISLCAFTTSGFIGPKPCVRHISDEAAKHNPAVRISEGLWDYVK